MKRSAVREMALQALFACELGKNDPATVLDMLWEEKAIDKSAQDFCTHIVLGVLAKLDDIDNILSENTIEWNLKRMAAVDRNIMRMALFEMLYSNEIPRAVVLNEAIELGKKFGGEESSRFINGVLGKISKDLEAKGEERG